MTKWVTISEASVILGMSERTIWRRVSDGSIEAKLDGHKKLVKVVTDNDTNGTIDMPMTDKDGLIRWLKNELIERNKQIEQLRIEIKNNRDRSDAIIIRLTEELESQRRIFHRVKPERKTNKSFWKLLGKTPDDKDNRKN